MSEAWERLWRTAAEEYGAWEYWIQKINAEAELPGGARSAALTGLDSVRRLFGHGWLRHAVQTKHPLLALLLNSAPWTRDRIGEFGERLRILQAVPGFKKLARRLKQAAECGGALAELDIGYRLVRAGVEIEFYPAAEAHEPDILAKMVPPVYLEITSLRTPSEWEQGERTLHALTLLALTDPDVVSGGAIHAVLSDSLTAECQKRIRDAVQQVKETQKPVEIHMPGIVDMYFVPTAEKELAASWKAEGKVQQFLGPPLHSALVARVGRALADKVVQLPEGSPGIIVVYDNLAPLEEPPETIAALAQHVMSRHTNVVATILISSIFDLETVGTSANVADFGVAVTRRSGPIAREDLLMVENPSARFPVDVSKFARLF